MLPDRKRVTTRSYLPITPADTDSGRNFTCVASNPAVPMGKRATVNLNVHRALPFFFSLVIVLISRSSSCQLEVIIHKNNTYAVCIWIYSHCFSPFSNLGQFQVWMSCLHRFATVIFSSSSSASWFSSTSGKPETFFCVFKGFQSCPWRNKEWLLTRKL